MQPTNIQYRIASSPEEASYATWDLSDGDTIVLPDMITSLKSTSTKEDLKREIDRVVSNYQEPE